MGVNNFISTPSQGIFSILAIFIIDSYNKCTKMPFHSLLIIKVALLGKKKQQFNGFNLNKS